MKKQILGIAIISSLVFSCTNGSASTLENNPGVSEIVTKASNQKDHTSGKTVNLTKQDFLEKVMNYEKNQTEWVYEGDMPALIDFYADWCGPCRMAAPVLDELAAEYKGKIHI